MTSGARHSSISVRLFLHDYFRRDNNVLSFEAQECHCRTTRPTWMRGYYRNARADRPAANRAIDAVESANAGLLAQFRDWRGRLSNAEFTVSRERVYLRDPQRLEADPAHHHAPDDIHRAAPALPLAADTERRLAACDSAGPLVDRSARASVPAPLLRRASRHARDRRSRKRSFPSGSSIDCLVVRDFYHRYTVDEHTLLTLQAHRRPAPPRKTGLRRRVSPNSRPKSTVPTCSASRCCCTTSAKARAITSPRSVAIAASCARPFWRAGRRQGHRRVPHPPSSGPLRHDDLARSQRSRHGAPDGRTGRNRRASEALTLLTYADISSVNPTAMTPWRLEQLWRAYAVTSAELTRELETERIHRRSPSTPALGISRRLPDALSAHPFRSRNRSPHGAGPQRHDRRSREIAAEPGR